MRIEGIKSMLAQVGVKLKVESLDPVAATDKLRNLEFDLMAWNYYFIYDPDSIATAYYHPDLNQKRNNNKRAVALIEAGRKELNLDKRVKIYRKLEKVVYDDFLDLWLWWEKSPVAYHKYIQGFNLEMYLKDGGTYSYSHPLWFKDGKQSLR
jgi:ABC-type transport system substrate-binding protein